MTDTYTGGPRYSRAFYPVSRYIEDIALKNGVKMTFFWQAVLPHYSRCFSICGNLTEHIYNE